MKKFVYLVLALLMCSTSPSYGDEPSPFLDMASEFLQATVNSQNGGGGGGGIAGIAQIVGSLMQNSDSNGSGKGAGNGAAQILSGIGSFLQSMNQEQGDTGRKSGGGGNGLDPAMIMNVVSMFAGAMNNNNNQQRTKRGAGAGSGSDTPTMDAMLNIASSFLQNLNNKNDKRGEDTDGDDDDEDGNGGGGGGMSDAIMNMLPMAIQAFQTFTGPEMEKTEKKHKEHAHVLPPFLEHIHVIIDQFQQSELAQALFVKLGLNNVFKGFVGRDGKMDYDRLFSTLENQSYRRRWIKNAIIYMADWANYLSNPEVYQRYIATGQIMANSFLKSQGYPDSAQLNIQRPSETIANVIDHTARRQLNVKISSIDYVKPAISYLRDLLKLGKARELLQKVNATEVSEKLTDSLNLEVIEPVLKVHRAYRYIAQHPKCDQYVLCEINSHDNKQDLGLAGFKSGVTKFGSMAAAWFISSETGTPFWTLFATINDPYKCQKKYSVNCSGFHEGEVKVTTEYIHNEL